MARCPDATKRNSCKSCGVEYFEPADYDDNGGDGDGDGGGDGDSGYADEMGDELRCQIIIMPAFLHWQACRVKWQTLGKPEARIANVLASIACGMTNAHILLHFRLARNVPKYRLL